MTDTFAQSLAVFAQSSLAVFLEAAPFLLIGALVSGLVEVFVPDGVIERVTPASTAGRIAAGLAFGMVVPCCECGIVFAGRRLMLRGVPVSMAVSFMLAAPVINPVVIASTYAAFRGDLAVVALRCLIVAVVAAVFGYLLRNAGPADILRSYPGAASAHGGHGSGSASATDSLRTHSGTAPAAGGNGLGAACASGGHGPDAGHGLSGFTPLEAVMPLPLTAKLVRLAWRAREDFLDMGKILVIGTLAASAFKAFVPAQAAAVFEENLVLSVGFMMAMAVVLSVCSQADAFVAASFAGFPLAAKLAFVTLGPILDFKQAFMWRAVFNRRMLGLVVLVPAVVVGALCLALGLYARAFPGWAGP